MRSIVQLDVNNIDKSFGPERVLRSVSCGIETGSTLSILGPSGCGKTTLLRIIAGHESCDGGAIVLNGMDLRDIPPEERGIVYLSQQALLFPHLTVEGNVDFGLRIRGVPEDERRIRVQDILERIGMQEHAEKRVAQLSGGQQQRVAFARAIVIRPAVVLLDEPFGSLDSQTRTTMQDLYIGISRSLPLTSLFVTHDLREALRVGNRFSTLDCGRLTVWESKDQFVTDERSGAAAEVAFWKDIQKPERG
jgi:ABC-type Fe3+/spermidine/putrescine transport system ATPase subunit